MVGARPQFIKAAAVSRPLRQHHREILLHTGQHYDDAMSEQFFRELQIPSPEIELGVGSGSHAEQTGGMLIGIERAIAEHLPDMVLLYGDTNSTLAGALAAAKANVPIAHVEAGVRSFNRTMPEEVNRVVTDQLASLLLSPSATAVANLKREGITNGVHEVGDVMWEMLDRARANSDDAAILRRHAVSAGQYYVATIHRADNTDDPSRLAAIAAGLNALDADVILPAHPRLRAALSSWQPASHVHFIDPVGHGEMLTVVRNARVLITDSGGLQKEAYWLAVPCVTVRSETEWVETIATGWNVLATPSTFAEIAANIRHPSSRPPLYGEGAAAGRIVSILGQNVPETRRR